MTQDSKLGKTKLKGGVKPEQKEYFIQTEYIVA